jgi:hypothetical protein
LILTSHWNDRSLKVVSASFAYSIRGLPLREHFIDADISPTWSLIRGDTSKPRSLENRVCH